MSRECESESKKPLMSMVRREKLCVGCFFLSLFMVDHRETPASAVEENGFPPNWLGGMMLLWTVSKEILFATIFSRSFEKHSRSEIGRYERGEE